MTATTTRYALAKIVLGSDNVDVVADFNNNWDAIDLKLGTQVCTFATLPASPPQGMTAFATDNNSFWVNDGTPGSPSWVNVNPTSDWYNVVTRYGADPTGAVEAAGTTGPIQLALNACNAAGGGIVYIPPGTYKCTPVGSPAIALNMSGMQGVTLLGANNLKSQLKKNGVGTLINMSGAATDLTGNTHCKYCTVQDIFLNGNALTGTLIFTYYADNLTFHRMRVKDNYDICVDTAEFWDSRFYNCVFETSGSIVTANALMPNILLRNSAAASGFGFSTDNVDNIYFWGCRFEDFRNGAVRIMQGVSSTNNASKIFFTDTKLESSFLFGGAHFQSDSSCQGIFVDHLYAFSGGFESGFSTAQDVIVFSSQASTLEDVFISNRASTASVANGVTLNSFTADLSTTVKNITGFYNTAPTGAHLNFGTVTGFVEYSGIESNNGAIYGGVTPKSRNKASIVTTTTINTTGAQTLQTTTIPANDPNHGATYSMKGYGQLTSVAGSPTMTFAVLYGGVALCSIPAITIASALSNLPFEYEILLNFQTSTSVVSLVRLSWVTNTGTGVTNTYANTKTATTVTTNVDAAFIMQFTWSAAGGNTISLLGGRTIKEI